jgi:hypothetical protein
MRKQGCGSGLIWYGSGSGSSIFAQSGSGSKLKQNFRRKFPSQIFLKSKFESNQIKNTGVIHQIFFSKSSWCYCIPTFLVVKFFFYKLTKKCIFPPNFFIFLPLDPDPGSQYGSGSTTLCARVHVASIGDKHKRHNSIQDGQFMMDWFPYGSYTEHWWKETILS